MNQQDVQQARVHVSASSAFPACYICKGRLGPGRDAHGRCARPAASSAAASCGRAWTAPPDARPLASSAGASASTRTINGSLACTKACELVRGRLGQSLLAFKTLQQRSGRPSSAFMASSASRSSTNSMKPKPRGRLPARSKHRVRVSCRGARGVYCSPPQACLRSDAAAPHQALCAACVGPFADGTLQMLP